MTSPLRAARRCTIVTILMLCAAVTSRRAPAQTIRVISDVLVDATPPGRAVEEPHLAVDPRDPNHLLAAVMVAPPPGAAIAEQYCATFSSANGGVHWVRHDFPIIECYDPWVVFLPAGGALFSALGSDKALAGEGNGLLVYHSADGGGTWDPRPAGLSWGWDHPMLAVDTSAAKRGWVYLVSSRDQKKNGSFLVAVSRSLDGGKSFDAPRNIAPEGKTVKAEPPVVLSDGTLMVPYVDLAEAGVMLPRRRAFVVKSANGIDFSRPTFIGDTCGQPPGFLLSSFAADATAGAYHGRLYFTCTLGGSVGAAVSHSSDRGATWSAAKLASNDTVPGPSPRSLMATAVTSNGVFALAWLEHRVGSPAGCKDVYVAASFDGGDRFTAPARVSQASSCPKAKLNGPGIGYGDYFALAPDSRGRLRLAWADARTGLLQLHTALIELAGRVGPAR